EGHHGPPATVSREGRPWRFLHRPRLQQRWSRVPSVGSHRGGLQRRNRVEHRGASLVAEGGTHHLAIAVWRGDGRRPRTHVRLAPLGQRRRPRGYRWYADWHPG